MGRLKPSGLKTNHSCETALVKPLDDWIASVDKTESVGTVCLDLSKAFDLVDHSILLKCQSNITQIKTIILCFIHVWITYSNIFTLASNIHNRTLRSTSQFQLYSIPNCLETRLSILA